MLRNEHGDAPVTLGLFQGMFERNLLTFNPGWDARCNTLPGFTDVRDLHAALQGEGVETAQDAGLDGSGPDSFVVVDPDGNPILLDQHIPKPDA